MTKSKTFIQEPVAIVGFACRLPGGNNTPQKLWDFLERGDVASRDVPKTRFSFEGHYDGSLKPKTLRQDGGMFLGDIDPAEFDAGFFEVGRAEAVAMDPNQRQMLEVVFEGLENAGIPLEKLDDQHVGCFVGSYAADYADMQNRDPEDRPANNALGVGRAILANRISHFLNIKGPSVTVDTACSGSLQGLDFACRYLQSGDIEAAIVATSNLYMSPEHLIDTGSIGSAHSPTALCHTFDVSADGYVKAEAVSAIIVKRLEDAVRDRDPIRAIVLGTASNSNGRTAGIASPSSAAQAMAIRAAYAHAGITDPNLTTYLECHGTGTQAGDPTEVRGVGSVFAATRPADKPLLIGSIKSNIGHSEPAAGISGLLKVILSLENGWIPGTPTFINPSPKIDFIGNKVKAFRTGIPWPEDAPRRASVNSFGYGGSNAHAILEQPKETERASYVSSYTSADEDFDMIEEDAPRPTVLVLSANDAVSLQAGVTALGDHLINPRVRVDLSDLSYTLSQRRSRLWHRAFITTRNTQLDEKPGAWFLGKGSHNPSFGFVFTGQGAQWPQMGRDLLEFFPWTRQILEELDSVLQSLHNPPSWSLIAELTESRTAEHMRQPEFSQPLVTALQLCILAVLDTWGIRPSSVVGHSSGEIAAAYSAGFLDRGSAITAAYYRGRAALNCKKEEKEGDSSRVGGMLAVGLGADATMQFLEKHGGQAWIACFNSPNSVTVSGRIPALDALMDEITAAGHFARRLQVDLAYHSELMDLIGNEYETLLAREGQFRSGEGDSDVTMFSSVTETKRSEAVDASYWKTNMVSPVRFDAALKAMLEDGKAAPNFLIEIGPSGALAGPVSQVLKSLPPAAGGEITYCAAWTRGTDAGKTLFDLAGRLWVAGAPIDMAIVNGYDGTERTITDLPNYKWNHSVKYWHENAASKDWRFRKYPVHDLLGSKILGTSWNAPTWRCHLNIANLPWLMDHKMGGNAIMPGAGFVTMAVEAMYQKHCALLQPEESAGLARNDLCYRIRNVRFSRALVLEEGKEAVVTFTLMAVPGDKHWHEFRISTVDGDVSTANCWGLVRIQDPMDEPVQGEDALPLKSPQAPRLWYKGQLEIGMDFGPAFQKLLEIEAVTGQRKCRTIISLSPAKSKYEPQSYYPIHPAALDGCLQTVVPSNASCDRTNIKSVMIPALIDDFVINKVPAGLSRGLSKATSVYSGRGRLEIEKSWVANTTVYDAETGQLAMRITGLNYTKLDVAPKPDPHTFHSVVWKPDISALTQDQMIYLEPGKGCSSKLDEVINLIAHKKPSLRVLEVNLDESDTSCLWFGSGASISPSTAAARAAYGRYDFCAPDAKTLVALETQHKEKNNVSFHRIATDNNNNPAANLPAEASSYDLMVVKSSEKKAEAEEAIRSLKPLLAKDAFTLRVILKDEDTTVLGLGNESKKFKNARGDESNKIKVEVRNAGSASPSSGSDILLQSESPLTSAASSIIMTDKKSVISLDSVDRNGAGVTLAIGPTSNSLEAYLTRSTVEEDADVVADNDNRSRRQLVVARLSEITPEGLAPGLQAMLETSGWIVQHRNAPFAKLAPASVVLVLDELSGSVLTQVNEVQWEAVKALISSGNRVLWVTKGGQSTASTDPDKAMVQGLFRVARQEDPSVKLTTLDVQCNTSSATTWAIDKVLQLISHHGEGGPDGLGGPVETEYMERNGILHVPRIVPDTPLNDFRHAEELGLEPVVKPFHGTNAQVQLRAEKLGTLQSLMWCETEIETEAEAETGKGPALVAGTVEVEVMAVGVNFKDVAITMGIVPDDEYNIGFECAGIVKRMGPSRNGGQHKFRVGDRVCILKAGSYANRVRVFEERCHVIPPSMSFEEAATIPSVYLCCLYAMYHLGCLKEGQSVLIHSATGGVGIACIQLAQYKKAEIFVTVGTEEKRKFLEDNYQIPRSRMFSSRNTKFADEIMRATDGRGVNVVINSLIGELLDASWRIMADGGNMVEIGKRDIVDRNTLSMEPFDRNCSFRAVDFSFTKDITDSKVEGLFDELFVLIDSGHIKPISPITTFGFDDVVSALSYIRSGRHLGKIVIANPDKTDVEMPIRPAVRGLRLRDDVSYLIVGGLKGACGTLAIHMAQHGARYIIVCSRSGINDDASARIVASCDFFGCTVVEARCDVGDRDAVLRMFKSASPRIAGIVQGAMVLRDKPLETMTLDDYHTAIHPKVQGTWNLHLAASQTLKRPLDFFTMLSSTSGIVGNKGQANYAAANSFLDAFASYRRSLGLRANTVDLGLIEDVGYVAEQATGLEARFDKAQWTPINETMLRKILTYSILQQDDANGPVNPESRAQMITGVGYPLPKDGSSPLASEPRFAYLFHGRGGSSDGSGGIDSEGGEGDQADQAIKLLKLLLNSSSSGGAAADPASLNSTCLTVVSGQFAKILRLEGEPEPARPLVAYGLDSLSAVELRNWIRVKLGVELSTLDITNASSLIALSEKIVGKLQAAQTAHS